MTSPAELYRRVAAGVASHRQVGRIRLSRETWDDLLAALDNSGPALTLPANESPLRAHNPADLGRCVGLMHGLPVLIKNDVALGEFELE